MSLQGKKILVGITGGIAAYKTCELIRIFVKAGAQVTATVTPNAFEFVTETTLQTLTRNPVYSKQFQVENWKPEHISLADSHDFFVIAPASANTIGKITNGICDNLLTSLVAAFKNPVIFVPAMNCNMWDNKFVQQNIEKLKQNGCHIIEPASGQLACGYEGKGRMAEPVEIFEFVKNIAGEGLPDFEGKKVLVTAGGTKEEIDPVRYIGNYSSGKMGIAIADAAYEAGAQVVLVSTVSVKKDYEVINVKSANQMAETVKKEFDNSDYLIMAAAVADYRPADVKGQKIKKIGSDTLTIELIKNPDILAQAAETKKSGQTVGGFCAESENLVENALDKLKRKNLDFIVANDISNPEIGFDSDYNAAILIDKKLQQFEFQKMSKKELANNIIKSIVKKS